LSQKKIFVGNRKLVLKVIQKNPGSSLWCIKRKLREVHEDWRPNIFTIIRHILVLHSANLVAIKPEYNISELKKIIRKYGELKRKRRQNLSKLEAERRARVIALGKEIAKFAKKISIKTRCYPIKVEKIDRSNILLGDMSVKEVGDEAVESVVSNESSHEEAYEDYFSPGFRQNKY